MFGLFKKKKRKELSAAEVASGVVTVQLALGGTDLPAISAAVDRIALGYIFGAHDAACQSMGIQSNSSAGFKVLSIGFQLLAGTAGSRILEQCLSMQTNTEFHQGMELGGREVFALLRENKNPTGLAKHLHG